ncbi:MAG: uroporphyrinogen-III C-methyltransferase [Proteobacteria bacterium]|uniref:uroporphyrinogen-III C-methyltransferase n=1 Tax=Rudaea sp. TaxID=2136325 RepID=UPI0037844AB6|nr:uroporphyrinogen-III C-methyltransferase [Pseudomonadota bacterium]
MSENDAADSFSALPPPAESSPAPTPVRRRGAGGFGWLLLVLILAAAGYGYWRLQNIEQGHEATVQTEASAAQKLRDEVEALRRSADASKNEAQTLRTRLDDTAKVNESLRAQVLGLSERARLSEDAIANLAEKRLSGHDAFLLDEAELLLVLAQERYALFADPAPSLAAYRLADAALAQANDAAFASVRQSIQAEVAALGALETNSPSMAQQSLAQLRDSLAQLPSRQNNEESDKAQPGSRFARIFGQFIRIRRDDDAGGRFGRNDPLLARALLDASLRGAQGALLIRDASRWQQALTTARAQLAHDFDAAAPDVAKAQAALDALAKTAIAPPAPNVLGAALKELRNLRTTHSLQAPPAAAPAKPAAPAQPEGQS